MMVLMLGWRIGNKLLRLTVHVEQDQNKIFECKLSDAPREAGMEVRIDTYFIPKRKGFKYLGSLIQENGEIDDGVTHRICDKKVPANLKDKFYKVVVRLTPLYGVKCWSVKNSHVQKNMCRHTRRDKFRNEDIQDKLRVASVVEKLRETKLRWFEHVKRNTQMPQYGGQSCMGVNVRLLKSGTFTSWISQKWES
ncbi:hypothetical protein H5410_049417 [Solanum commersonii]|uniref:Uncharacterized protein n=1 Tax=Solanum commersonii TaxID=4109 RepID=A0A9J5WV15_SOLCO|nr:hypothetical protein H5410_049417 [Solanum commersonii]